MVLLTRETLRHELKETSEETVQEVKYALQSVLGRELAQLKQQLEENFATALGAAQSIGSAAHVPVPTPKGLAAQHITFQRSNVSETSAGQGDAEALHGNNVSRTRQRAPQAPIRHSVAPPLLGLDSGGEVTESQGISWFMRHRKGYSKSVGSSRSKSRLSGLVDADGHIRGSLRNDKDPSYVALGSDTSVPGDDEETNRWTPTSHGGLSSQARYSFTRASTDLSVASYGLGVHHRARFANDAPQGSMVSTTSVASEEPRPTRRSGSYGRGGSNGSTHEIVRRDRKVKTMGKSMTQTTTQTIAFNTKETAWERAAQKRSSKNEDSSRMLRAAMEEGDICLPACLVEFYVTSTIDYVTGFVILFNAIVLGVQTDFMARYWTSSVPFPCQVLELCCCAYFLFEITLRLLILGCRNYFFGDEWFSNTFDAMLVSAQLVDDLSQLFVKFHADGLRMVRIMRLLRVFRIVRILHLFGDLRMLLIAIAESGKSVCWCVVLLGLMTFCISVYLTQVVTDHKIRYRDSMAEEEKTSLESFFGTLDVSMLSLYQMISEGIHWHEVLEPLTTYCNPWLALVFVIYMGFTVFAMLNVVTGVFVDTAMQSAQEDRRKVLMSQMREFFHRADQDGSGTMTMQEFQDQMGSSEMQAMLKAVDLDEDEAVDLFNLLDMAEEGELEVDSFVHGVQRLSGYAKAIELSAFVHEWKRWVKMWQLHAMFLEEGMENLLVGMEAAEPQNNAEQQPPRITTENLAHVPAEIAIESTSPTDHLRVCSEEVADWAPKTKDVEAHSESGDSGEENATCPV